MALSLLNEDGSRGHIPRGEADLKMGIEDAFCHEREVERRCAKTPDCGALKGDVLIAGDVLGDPLTAAVVHKFRLTREIDRFV